MFWLYGKKLLFLTLYNTCYLYVSFSWCSCWSTNSLVHTSLDSVKKKKTTYSRYTGFIVLSETIL